MGKKEAAPNTRRAAATAASAPVKKPSTASAVIARRIRATAKSAEDLQKSSYIIEENAAIAPNAGESDFLKFARLAERRHEREETESPAVAAGQTPAESAVRHLPPEAKARAGKSGTGRKLLYAACLLLFMGIGAAGGIIGYSWFAGRSIQSAERQARERANTLSLIQRYLEAGLYDEALSLLNGLLIKNADDADARLLLDKTAELKKLSESLADAAGADDATAAMQEIIDSLRRELSRQSEDNRQHTQTMQEQLARQTEESKRNAEAMQEQLNRQTEESKRNAEAMQEQLARQTEESKRNAEAMQEQLARQTEESKRNAEAMQEQLARQTEESKRSVAAMQEQLARQTEESKRNAEALQQELARQTEENKRNVQAMNELMRTQQEQAEALRAAEAERRAQQEAEAKQRAEQEARRKAEEERKAAESLAAAKLIKDINDELAKGKAALGAGNVNGALAHFNKAKSMLPSDDPGFAAAKLSEISGALYAASRQLADGDPGKASLMQQAVAFADGSVMQDDADPAAHYILAMDAFDKKDYAKAETELRKAVAADGTNPMYCYQLGRAQAQQRKYEAAASSFQASVTYNAAYAPAQYNLGYVSERLGRNAQALAAYRKAYQLDAAYERAYLAAGRLLARQGDYNGAVAAFSEAIRVNPSNAQNYQEQGSAYSSAGNYQAAERSFKKAIACMDPKKKDPLTYYNLSTVMYAQGKAADALSYAEQAYANKAEAAPLLAVSLIYNYALLCDEAGDGASAIALYKEVLAADAQNVKALTNLGVLCLEQGEPDSAVSFLNRAYTREPDNFEVNNNLGNAFRMRGDYDSAVTYYQNALKIQPRNNTVRENLAKAYAAAGRYDNAKTTYEEVVAASPAAWESWLELAKVCLSLKDTDTARKYLSYLQTQNPAYEQAQVSRLLNSL